MAGTAEREITQYNYLTAGIYTGIFITAFSTLSMAGCFSLPAPTAPALMMAGITMLLLCGIAISIRMNFGLSKALWDRSSEWDRHVRGVRSTETAEDRVGRKVRFALDSISALAMVVVATYVNYQLLLHHASVNDLLSLSHAGGALLATCLAYAFFAIGLAVFNLHTLLTKQDVDKKAKGPLSSASVFTVAKNVPIALGAVVVTAGVASNNIPTLIAGASLFIGSFLINTLFFAANYRKQKLDNKFYSLSSAAFFGAGATGFGAWMISQTASHQNVSWLSPSAILTILFASFMALCGVIALTIKKDQSNTSVRVAPA